MTLGYGQPLHGGKLVAAGRVCDLQRAHLLVAADHLSVGVLNRRDVAFPKGAANEPQHQRALADPARPEHHHSVVVALLRHHAQSHRSVLRNLREEDRTTLKQYYNGDSNHSISLI